MTYLHIEVPLNKMNKHSLWWRDVSILSNLKVNGQSWFDSCLFYKLGSGPRLDFWNQCWIGVTPLKYLFSEFVGNCSSMDYKVAAMGFWFGD